MKEVKQYLVVCTLTFECGYQVPAFDEQDARQTAEDFIRNGVEPVIMEPQGELAPAAWKAILFADLVKPLLMRKAKAKAKNICVDDFADLFELLPL